MTTAALPLADGKRDARASGHPLPPAGGHRLSMVHKTSNDNPADPPDSIKSPVQLFQVWKEGALAILPGIPNFDPQAEHNTGNRGGIRGKVVTLSDASRRKLMLYLATIGRDAQGYTMALTLPGDFKSLSSARVHMGFKKLLNQFTGSRLFPGVGFIWKRELQRRGALHYHLLLYGLESPATRRTVQGWIANHWNALVCAGLSDEEKGKHLRVHLHPTNMEKVRKNFAGYFAKYLGKPLESVCEEIPGRWWGKVNVKALPISERSEMPLPERAAVIAHRVARKIQQKRADAAKHYRLARELGMVDFEKQPLLSQFDMIAMKGGHLTKEQQMCGAIMQRAAQIRGKRWGKCRKFRFAKYSKIRLISNTSPATAIQIMRYVGQALKDWMERNPY